MLLELILQFSHNKMNSNKNNISAEIYALAMENAPVAFQLFELVDENDLGSFTYRAVNIASEIETGANVKSFIGKTLREAAPEFLKTGYQHIYKQALDEQETKDIGIFEYGDKKIKTALFDVKVYPINKSFVGVIITNVTKQIDAENKLKIKIKEVEENAKEMEQITYIASHDLQEPLTTIKSMVEWLRQRYEHKLDDKGKKGVEFVIDSVSRMKTLIKDLMDFSKIGQELTEVEEINTQILVKEVISDLDTSVKQAGAKITISELPILKAFRTDLRILFQNLISNSIKFRNPNSSVKITVQAEEKDKYWQFCIADNGIGIDKKYQNKIFAIFKRLHGREYYDGTGIGLAHCKKVVERHEGEIWVESEEGKGSSFYFTLAKKLLR